MVDQRQNALEHAVAHIAQAVRKLADDDKAGALEALDIAHGDLTRVAQYRGREDPGEAWDALLDEIRQDT